MKKIVGILFIAVLFSACGNKGGGSNSPGDETIVEEKVLYTQETSHSFSDNNAADTFSLKVVGKDILSANVKFQIISAKNQIIFVDNFKATDLIGYAFNDVDPAKVTDEMKVDFIRKRLKTFFDKANFKSPAIGPDAMFDDNYSDEEAWNDIKADNSAVGFHYLTGKSSVKYIAFSKRLEKVVVYLTCC
jgi:hypothetical protein